MVSSAFLLAALAAIVVVLGVYGIVLGRRKRRVQSELARLKGVAADER